MRSLIIVLASVLTISFSNSLNAQSSNTDELASIEKMNSSGSEDVAILKNFKPNKTQKRVIRKIKKYVTPRVIKKGVRTNALVGKTVTVQLSLDKNGEIKNMQIVKGFEESLDARVLEYIIEFDSKNPLAESKLERPAVIQLEIPLVGKTQYMH